MLDRLTPGDGSGERFRQRPQTLGPPPPQVSGAVQLPQLSVPPQPSEIIPQLACSAAQVVLTHASLLSIGPESCVLPPLPPPPMFCWLPQPRRQNPIANSAKG